MDDRAKDKAKRRKEAEVFKKKGNAFLEEGKLRSAFAQYTKGLEQDKSSRALLLNRALCCLKLNNKTVKIEKLGEEVELNSFQQCIDDCTKTLDICEFLYDNAGPGIKQNRVKAHMRRAEAKNRVGKLAEAVSDIEDAFANIPNLSPQDKQQLNELIAKFKSDKDCNDRVKRLRELAGVTDISVPEQENAEGAQGGEGAESSKGGAPRGAAADLEADKEAAGSSPSSVSSSSSSPKSGAKVEEVHEKETSRGAAGEEGGEVAPVVGAKMRNPANAALVETLKSPLLIQLH
jgi:tetratricopeptide (TPR) repeat protein